MTRTKGACLTKTDKYLLRKAVNYTLEYLLPKDYKADYRVFVTVTNPDPSQAKNLVADCDLRFNKKTKVNTIRIWLNAKRIRRKAPTHLWQFALIIKDLCHELIHAKQFLVGELVNVNDKYYKFGGKRYKYPKDSDTVGYLEQPHEIEAYGREKALYLRFKKYMKKVEMK